MDEKNINTYLCDADILIGSGDKIFTLKTAWGIFDTFHKNLVVVRIEKFNLMGVVFQL